MKKKQHLFNALLSDGKQGYFSMGKNYKKVKEAVGLRDLPTLITQVSQLGNFINFSSILLWTENFIYLFVRYYGASHVVPWALVRLLSISDLRAHQSKSYLGKHYHPSNTCRVSKWITTGGMWTIWWILKQNRSSPEVKNKSTAAINKYKVYL